MKHLLLVIALIGLPACTILKVEHVPGIPLSVNDASDAHISAFSAQGLITIWLNGPTKKAIGTSVSWDHDTRSFKVDHYNLALSVLDKKCFAASYNPKIYGDPLGPYSLFRIAVYGQNGLNMVSILAPNNSDSAVNSIEKHVQMKYLVNTLKTDEGYYSRLKKEHLENYLNKVGYKMFARLSTDHHDTTGGTYQLDSIIQGKGQAASQLNHYIQNCYF